MSRRNGFGGFTRWRSIRSKAGSCGLRGLGLVFLLWVGPGGAAAADAPAEGKYRWRIASSWSVQTPVLGELATRFANDLRVASQGRLDVRVEEPVYHKSPQGVLDMVRSGTHEMGLTATHFARGRESPLLLFAALSANMSESEKLAWLKGGGGVKRLNELTGLQGLYCHFIGNHLVERGLWTRREIRSLEDLRALRLRLPGDASPGLRKLGLRTASAPAAELHEALATGRFDALEWPGASESALINTSQGNFSYYPGWLDPGAEVVFLVNRDKQASLPPDLQILLSAAIKSLVNDLLGASVQHHQLRLEKLAKSKVAVRPLSRELVSALREANEEALREQTGRSSEWEEIFQERQTFVARWREWARPGAAAP